MLRLLAVCVMAASPAAAETLGVWTFTPPADYTLAESANTRRGYTKITGKTFCSIGVYVPRVATSDSAVDVKKEWADLIEAQFSATKVVTETPTQTKTKLTQHAMAAELSDKSGTYYGRLLVLRDSSNIGSVRLLSNSEKTSATCLPAALAVVDSIIVAASAPAVSPATAPASGKTRAALVSKWSAASSATESGTGMWYGSITRQYDFRSDGTYTFHRETWFGHHGPPRWYVVDEVGTYRVDEKRLTVTPKSVKGVTKDDKNNIVKTENPIAETTTYEWTFHYFSGLQEDQLVLTTAKETARDGAFVGSTEFPKSYLYSNQRKTEWRYP